MSDEGRDLVGQYRAYLDRFEAVAGPGEFGSFVKYRGRLIKKMRYDEFEPKYSEWQDVAQAYRDSVERGDTINDLVVKILRERCDELLIDPPSEL